MLIIIFLFIYYRRKIGTEIPSYRNINVQNRRKKYKIYTQKSQKISREYNNTNDFLDIETKILYANDILINSFGYKSEKDVLGENLDIFFRSKKIVQEIKEKLFEKGSWIKESNVKTKDNKLLKAKIYINAVKDGITLLGYTMCLGVKS